MKLKFNRAGWIVLHEWKHCPIVGEYMNTIRFDDMETAVFFLENYPERYTVDSECQL